MTSVPTRPRGDYSADIRKRERNAQHDAELLTLPVVENNNGDYDGDNDQEEGHKAETYPPFLASRASGTNRVSGVTQACFRIFLDVGSGFLDDIDRFILLFDQDTHLRVNVGKMEITRENICTYIIEQLCQFCESAFYLLDVLVPLLDFPIGSLRLAVSVRIHQLQKTVSTQS